MNLPPKLKLNDEVIIIAQARKVELESLIMAENLLLKWGLKPLRSKNILEETSIFSSYTTCLVGGETSNSKRRTRFICN